MGRIEIPENVNYILSELTEHGFEAYIVGGCVRDSIMGATPHDWDICTSATPDDVLKIFPSETIKVIGTGLKHGTVSIIIDSIAYEVTTFRIDGEYSDNRHPESVRFTSNLKDDLSRRDFTINAIAYNPTVGFVDYFGGREDIASKVIRCVGNPFKRFEEDALRIMRAVRFATSLSFYIEPETYNAMMALRHSLLNISMERINHEMIKTLKVRPSWELLTLIQVFLPELNGIRINEIIRYYPNNNLVASLISIFDFTYSDEVTLSLLKRFRFSNKIIKDIIDTKRIILQILSVRKSKSPLVCCKLILNKREDIAEQVIDCFRYIRAYKILNFETMEGYSFADELLELLPIAKESCYKLSQMKVKGTDISQLFIEKDIGKVLNQILSQIIEGHLKNEHREIMDYVHSLGDNFNIR